MKPCLANLKKGLLFTFFNSRPAIFLGNVSYSFYLLQGFVILPANKFFKHLAGNFLFANNTMITLTLFTITLLISSLCYIYVEKPCRRYIVKKYLPTKTPVNNINTMPVV